MCSQPAPDALHSKPSTSTASGGWSHCADYGRSLPPLHPTPYTIRPAPLNRATPIHMYDPAVALGRALLPGTPHHDPKHSHVKTPTPRYDRSLRLWYAGRQATPYIKPLHAPCDILKPCTLKRQPPDPPAPALNHRYDHSLRLWDVERGVEREAYHGSSKAVYCVAAPTR